MLVTPAPAAGHPLSALDGTRLDEPASEPRSPRSECRELMALRAQFLAPNLATFFANDPIELARASGCEVTDARGATYLDCINNVSHVGHCHPHVRFSERNAKGCGDARVAVLHSDGVCSVAF